MRKSGTYAALLAILAGSVAAADERGQRRAEVELEDLHAELAWAGAAWQVNVSYEIEAEGRADAVFGLHLVLSARDERGILADPEGQPIEVAVALDRPSYADDREFEFRAGAALTLPEGSFAHPRDLRVDARIVDSRDGAVLEADYDYVSYDRRAWEPVYVAPAPAVLVGPPPAVVVHSAPVVVAPPAQVGVHLGFHVSARAPVMHRTAIHRTVVVRPAYGPPTHTRHVVVPGPRKVVRIHR